MLTSFFQLFSSEWLKLKRSVVLRLCIAGAFIVPIIMLIAAFANRARYIAQIDNINFWEKHFSSSWQFMNMFLLPLGIILVISLIFQLEHSSYGWRQLQLLPIQPALLFVAKLALVMVLALIFVLLFNLGNYLSGLLPAALMSNADLPTAPFPLLKIVKRSLSLTAACLPVVTLQFTLSLLLRNFMLPVGIGIGLFVASLIAISWKYGGFVPYTWPALEFMQTNVQAGYLYPYRWILYAYSGLFLAIGFVLYQTRKIKD